MNLYITEGGDLFTAIVCRPTNKNNSILSLRNLTDLEQRILTYLVKMRVINGFEDLYIGSHGVELISKRCPSFISITYYSATKQIVSTIQKLNATCEEVNLYGKLFRDVNFDVVTRHTEFLRNKHTLGELLRSCDLIARLPRGVMFSNYDELVSDIKSVYESFDTEKILIKSSWGIGGKGNLLCCSESDLDIALSIINRDYFEAKAEYSTSCLDSTFRMEEYITNGKSYNAFATIDGGSLRPSVFVTDQLVDEVFYRGNEYPSHASKNMKSILKNDTKKLLDLLSNKYSYLGPLGVDYMSYENKLYINEINPRTNSVTHAHLFSRGKSFTLTIMTCPNYKSNVEKLVSSLEESLYNPETGVGLLPYRISKFSIVFLLIYNNDEMKKMYETDLIKAGFKYIKQKRIESHSLSISHHLLQGYG